jgi:superfamily II DNA helicase RecQ
MCIVVSPLIALMDDQVAALSARGVKAAMLGSAQTSAEVCKSGSTEVKPQQ